MGLRNRNEELSNGNFIANFPAVLRSLGPAGVLAYYVGDKLTFLNEEKVVAGTSYRVGKLRPGASSSPVYYRCGTSDRHVFKLLFVENEYDFLRPLEAEGVQTVVDCGANVGYASVALLNRFPGCRVLAIEPDPANFEMARLNTAFYGKRCEVLQGAVWSRSCDLVVRRGEFRDGSDWSIIVRPAKEDETPDVRAFGMAELLGTLGDVPIDLLKIDVEGSERELFRDGTDAWLPKVRNIVIELHDDQCRETFLAAVSSRPHAIVESGELTWCQFRD